MWILKFFFALFSACFFCCSVCLFFFPRFLLKIGGPRTEGEEEKTGGKEDWVFVCC